MIHSKEVQGISAAEGASAAEWKWIGADFGTAKVRRELFLRTFANGRVMCGLESRAWAVEEEAADDGVGSGATCDAEGHGAFHVVAQPRAALEAA